MQSDLTPFFNPLGVAIVGASSNPAKLSFGIFKNLTQYGFHGNIYPVNPNANEILGLPCYPDLASVPDPLDLVVSVISGAQTPAILEACGQRGVKAVTIISGGFREVGSEGESLEKRCLEIAKHYGIRLVGPNCVGTMDLHSGLNTTFIYGVPDTGHIGFLSQSGAICGGIVDYVRSKKVGFSNFVSLGNMADVNETDMIEYLATDPNTRVITLYLEGIQDGRRFLETARRVSRVKPIIVLKAGKTSAGARAVSSHTGSIAGSHSAYQAAFQQAGVIEVETVAELFNVALAFDLQPISSGGRAAIVTNSGGPAALASDSLAANGLTLASLTAGSMQELRAHLNPSAQVSNPVDMLGGAEPADYGMALAQVASDPEVDVLIPILVPQALIKPVEVAKQILRVAETTRKPIAACFMGDQAVAEARQVLHDGGVPMYIFPDEVGYSLGAINTYGSWLQKSVSRPSTFDHIDAAAARAYFASLSPAGSLGEMQTRRLLECYGFPVVPGSMARSDHEAGEIAEKIGRPVVLKIVSPDLLHKSDVGGIRLGLNGREVVEGAYRQLMAELAERVPNAHLEGAMVEAMAPKGIEVIVGMRRDANFGPVLMFGLGGTYVELFADVAFGVAPVSVDDAREMIARTKAGKLLEGFRGSSSGDLHAVVDCLCRLGQLALDFPEIAEIEINPLVVYGVGQGVMALDCRAVL